MKSALEGDEIGETGEAAAAAVVVVNVTRRHHIIPCFLAEQDRIVAEGKASVQI
jgi:hypothetical protein